MAEGSLLQSGAGSTCHFNGPETAKLHGLSFLNKKYSVLATNAMSSSVSLVESQKIAVLLLLVLSVYNQSINTRDHSRLGLVNHRSSKEEPFGTKGARFLQVGYPSGHIRNNLPFHMPN